MTCQHCNKTHKTENGLYWDKAKYKERDKPCNNNKHNIPLTSNDSSTAASRKIKYPWSETGNTISTDAIDIIFDKVVFWHKNLFLLPSGSCGKTYIEETTRLLNEWIHESGKRNFV